MGLRGVAGLVVRVGARPCEAREYKLGGSLKYTVRSYYDSDYSSYAPNVLAKVLVWVIFRCFSESYSKVL